MHPLKSARWTCPRRSDRSLLYGGAAAAGPPAYQNVFGETLAKLAETDPRICAITAAMLLRHQDGGKAGFVWPTAAALDKLAAHAWPGNARELGNVLQRALVLRDGDRIDAHDLHLASAPRPQGLHIVSPEPAEPVRLRDVAHHSKLEAVRTALRETDGHRAAAARKLQPLVRRTERRLLLLPTSAPSSQQQQTV